VSYNQEFFYDGLGVVSTLMTSLHRVDNGLDFVFSNLETKFWSLSQFSGPHLILVMALIPI